MNTVNHLVGYDFFFSAVSSKALDVVIFIQMNLYVPEPCLSTHSKIAVLLHISVEWKPDFVLRERPATIKNDVLPRWWCTFSAMTSFPDPYLRYMYTELFLFYTSVEVFTTYICTQHVFNCSLTWIFRDGIITPCVFSDLYINNLYT